MSAAARTRWASFYPFAGDADVRLIGVEAAGEGVDTPRHAATLTLGRPGVLHGAASYLLQDQYGQIAEAHSVSAGLDYPGVGPEHAYFKDQGRAEYAAITDADALDAFGWVARTEGIIPALETAHAFAHTRNLARPCPKTPSSSSTSAAAGDKDVDAVAKRLARTEPGKVV